MDKKILKQETERIKKILKFSKTIEQAHGMFDFIYERISNREDKDYDAIYDFNTIFQGKVLKDIRKMITKDTAVVVEITDYKDAPNGIIVIYNDFKGQEQQNIDIYVTKGVENEI